MRTILLSSVILFIMLSCATIGGKWGESRIDGLSEKCKEENLAAKPSTDRWHNLSTQARARKKREMDEYRKKRIELYQALYNFKAAYLAHVEKNGVCRKKECASLGMLRQLIIAGCPGTGESFPAVRNELK